MTIDLDALHPGTVALVGVPSDENSSLLRGPASAPGVIRSALYDPEFTMSTEDGRTLATETRFVDAGDLTFAERTPEAIFAAIVEQIGVILDRGPRVLALGGDHGVSYPLVRGHAARHLELSIVQFDAHPDLYDDFEGNRFSHASPFARIMEEDLASRLVQIGIRAATPHQRQQAARFGVEMLDIQTPEVDRSRLPDGPTYISLDLDGLDPAFAPGVSHPEPGGLSTREVLRFIRSLPGPIVGADVVELNPRRDVGGATAMVAAKMVKELASRMLNDAADLVNERR